LTLFTPEELELLVAGLPHLDFEALRQAARVRGARTRTRTRVGQGFKQGGGAG
jgi:hypothetical protein